MRKGIILYQSKYGATKQYALWLQEKTGFDCQEIHRTSFHQIKDYETLILGGGIYASGIAGFNFLKKYIAHLPQQNILVFAVGASPYDPTAFDQLYQRHFKDRLEGIPCFYCRGAWHEDRMTWVDRHLCQLLKRMVAKKDPADYEPWEKALMEAMGRSCDWTDPTYLQPILNYLEEHSHEKISR